jgi:hypothetical protein
MEEFPNWSKVELNSRNRILELEVLEDLWMKDSDSSNLLSRKDNIGSSSWEELRILALFNGEVLVKLSSDLGHEKAESTVDYLEGPSRVQLHDRDLSVVGAPSVAGHVDASSVADLKDLLRDSLVLVRVQSL